MRGTPGLMAVAVLALAPAASFAARPPPPPPPPSAAEAPPPAANVQPAPEPAPQPAAVPQEQAAPAPVAGAPEQPAPSAPAPVAPAAAAAPVPARPAVELETLALLPIRAPDEGLSTAATAQAAQALRDLRVFKVMDPESIAGLLGGEALRQTTGCTDQSCLAELAGAIGAPHFVSGTVSKAGDRYTINLVLTNQHTAQPIDGVLRTVDTVAEVADAVRVSAQRVVQKLLEGKTGVFRLVVSEAGADVKLDDVLVGVTPLAERTLPMGPHKLSVEKEGFLAFRQDVFVQPGQDTILQGTLVPNQAYINTYKRRNMGLRAAALGGLAVAASGLALGAASYGLWLAGYLVALKDTSDLVSVLGPPTVSNTPPFLYTSGAEFKDGFQNPAYIILLDLLLGPMVLAPLLIPVGLVVGGALWFFSDDPGRYNQYAQ